MGRTSRPAWGCVGVMCEMPRILAPPAMGLAMGGQRRTCRWREPTSWARTSIDLRPRQRAAELWSRMSNATPASFRAVPRGWAGIGNHAAHSKPPFLLARSKISRLAENLPVNPVLPEGDRDYRPPRAPHRCPRDDERKKIQCARRKLVPFRGVVPTTTPKGEEHNQTRSGRQFGGRPRQARGSCRRRPQIAGPIPDESPRRPVKGIENLTAPKKLVAFVSRLPRTPVRGDLVQPQPRSPHASQSSRAVVP
jgi:hypothetical protein